MRNKFLSLILGLIVILVSPMFTSCEKVAENDTSTGSAATETVITAEVSNALYVVPEVAHASTGSATIVTAVQDTSTSSVTESEDGYSWLSIVNILLAVLAAVFATFLIRAKSALKELLEALDDNRLTKQEIQDIVQAWKGK